MTSILIDTNLLLDDPEILYKLKEHYDKVVIPITVLKELDRHKFNPELSYSARQAINSIRDFKNKFKDKLYLPVNDDDVSTNDLRIIRSAKESNAVVATKDISMSIIAESKGVETLLYGNIANGVYDPYLYIDYSDLDNFDFQNLYKGRAYSKLFRRIGNKGLRHAWFFVFITFEDKTFIYAHNPKSRVFERIDADKEYAYIENKDIKFKAKDAYQKCAVYALKKAPNVLITGPWGSGKSLIATAYAIVYNHKKSFISRPPMGIDKAYEIGYLPGDLKAKLGGWAMGFLSAVYFLFGNTKAQTKDKNSFDFVKEEIFYNLFELIDINSLQGLSLLDDYLLVDEVQYATIDLVSMLLSRVNESSKLILTGDLNQSYCMKPSNSGLLKLLRVMPHHAIAYVDLKNSYRSSLLEVAEMLQDKSF